MKLGDRIDGTACQPASHTQIRIPIVENSSEFIAVYSRRIISRGGQGGMSEVWRTKTSKRILSFSLTRTRPATSPRRTRNATEQPCVPTAAGRRKAPSICPAIARKTSLRGLRSPQAADSRVGLLSSVPFKISCDSARYLQDCF